jgi:uncharacterized membrane protein (DUF485 family)
VSDKLERLSRRRLTIAVVLTAAMVVAYFGFILLVAYGKDIAGTLVGDDVSVGIILGAAVIVLAPVLTAIYVRWANRHYDSALAEHREDKPTSEPAAKRHVEGERGQQ